MIFEEAFKILIGEEGELSLDPNDRGNWTTGKIGIGELKGSKYGISAMTYPHIDIKNLTLDQARAIYKRDFWDTICLDKLPSEISFDIFDTSVNSGVNRAIRLLQLTVGSKEDGVIGPQTISKASGILPSVLKAHYNANRLLFMCNCAAWDNNSKGWVRRVANNLLR